MGYFSSGRSKQITFIERTYYMQVLCLGDQMWGKQRATSGVPADEKRVRMGSLGARGIGDTVVQLVVSGEV